MSNKDGSWRNDFVNKWRGITVFGAIAAAEALIYCGDILDKKDYDYIKARLYKAGEFMCDFFVIGNTNINYTATGGQALWLLGEFFDDVVLLDYSCENASARIVLPIIATSQEKLKMIDAKTAIIRKENCSIKISADKNIEVIAVGKEREFHFAPGFEFIPFAINSSSAKIKIEVV